MKEKCKVLPVVETVSTGRNLGREKEIEKGEIGKRERKRRRTQTYDCFCIVVPVMSVYVYVSAQICRGWGSVSEFSSITFFFDFFLSSFETWSLTELGAFQ